MRALKVKDTACNINYVNGNLGTQIVKNYLYDPKDYSKTLKLHFFTSYEAMQEYAAKNNLKAYKMPTFCSVTTGNSSDNHVYQVTC